MTGGYGGGRLASQWLRRDGGRLRVELWEARKIILITEEQGFAQSTGWALWPVPPHNFKGSYKPCKFVILNDDLKDNKVGNRKQ